ncbi:unannotated protein [freshwater metagenome]|uniref:Unannotated protein n=1 Tax=freshwater metagenome TaxID=449393 RepID=A0A6J6MBL8_9ZZZZ
MPRKAVVVTKASKANEVVDCLRRQRWVEIHHDGSLIGGDRCAVDLGLVDGVLWALWHLMLLLVNGGSLGSCSWCS